MQDMATTDPPALSTPATRMFEGDVVGFEADTPALLAPEQAYIRYEIERTVAEIRKRKWKRIALQFPDSMLPDAPSVFEHLSQQLDTCPDTPSNETKEDFATGDANKKPPTAKNPDLHKLFILADTSYGACCIDETAAEHVDADVVVHYGRACLSPTARLPVIHIFTEQPLMIESVVESFESTYQDHDQPIILTSDVTYASHLQRLGVQLQARGYTSIFVTEIIYSPTSPLPNRTVPNGVVGDPSTLLEWHLFHISSPPDSLLLTLSSRVSSLTVYPTDDPCATQGVATTSSAVALRRRYALLTSVSTVPIFGILINTLSVKNYLHIVSHVQTSIAKAGKKSYTFVVGKINAAKVANFGEIGAWVVIGCWESSLIDSKDFWKPMLTPFELELALTPDEERIWTGKWTSDFQSVLEDAERHPAKNTSTKSSLHDEELRAEGESEGLDYGLESTPPEFDLRSGRYVSQSRPMETQADVDRSGIRSRSPLNGNVALVRRVNGSELVTIGNQVSPGAEFLLSQRTWNGLGSGVEIRYDDSGVSDSIATEEGRNGLARGYLNAHSTTRT